MNSENMIKQIFADYTALALVLSELDLEKGGTTKNLYALNTIKQEFKSLLKKVKKEKKHYGNSYKRFSNLFIKILEHHIKSVDITITAFTKGATDRLEKMFEFHIEKVEQLHNELNEIVKEVS